MFTSSSMCECYLFLPGMHCTLRALTAIFLMLVLKQFRILPQFHQWHSDSERLNVTFIPKKRLQHRFGGIRDGMLGGKLWRWHAGKNIYIVGNGNAFLRCGCWKYERFVRQRRISRLSQNGQAKGWSGWSFLSIAGCLRFNRGKQEWKGLNLQRIRRTNSQLQPKLYSISVAGSDH